MQATRGSDVLSRKAADQGTTMLDDEARWHLAAELVEALRDAGYECELRAIRICTN